MIYIISSLVAIAVIGAFSLFVNKTDRKNIGKIITEWQSNSDRSMQLENNNSNIVTSNKRRRRGKTVNNKAKTLTKCNKSQSKCTRPKRSNSTGAKTVNLSTNKNNKKVSINNNANKLSVTKQQNSLERNNNYKLMNRDILQTSTVNNVRTVNLPTDENNEKVSINNNANKLSVTKQQNGLERNNNYKLMNRDTPQMSTVNNVNNNINKNNNINNNKNNNDDTLSEKETKREKKRKKIKKFLKSGDIETYIKACVLAILRYHECFESDEGASIDLFFKFRAVDANNDKRTLLTKILKSWQQSGSIYFNENVTLDTYKRENGDPNNEKRCLFLKDYANTRLMLESIEDGKTMESFGEPRIVGKEPLYLPFIVPIGAEPDGIEITKEFLSPEIQKKSESYRIKDLSYAVQGLDPNSNENRLSSDVNKEFIKNYLTDERIEYFVSKKYDELFAEVKEMVNYNKKIKQKIKEINNDNFDPETDLSDDVIDSIDVSDNYIDDDEQYKRQEMSIVNKPGLDVREILPNKHTHR